MAARLCTITPPRYWACALKRRICRCVPPVPGLYCSQIHENCVCNELVSLRNRHLQELPEPTKVGLKEFSLSLRRFSRHLHVVEPISDEEFASHYSGPKKTRYVNAAASLKLVPLTKRDAYVDAFIKAEKFDPGAKVNPDPRMIQARNPRYTMSIGKYMRPMFAQFKRIKDGIGTRMIVKGMNMGDRANLFVQKWQAFKRPVCFPIDGERFDAHLHAKVLSKVDGLYERLACCPSFGQMLRWRRRTRGKTMNGVKYSLVGRRCSGDFDTGDGNSIIEGGFIDACMRMLGIRKWAAEVDGDNAVLIVEEESACLVESKLASCFLQFGQEVAVEKPARQIAQVEMCRARMYERAPGDWCLVRDWRRVLSGETSGSKHWDQPSTIRSMFATVGVCDLALHAGMPVLQAHAEALVRIGGGARLRPDLLQVDDAIHRLGQELGCDPVSKAVAAKAVPITQFARESFSRTFGLGPEQQIALETALALWSMPTVQPVWSGREYDWRWVDMRPPDICVD